jgi:hypothetical protein
MEFLGGARRVVDRVVKRGKERVESVAAVDRGIQRLLAGVPLERDGVAHARREAPAIGGLLPEFPAIEHPHAAISLEDRTRRPAP